MSITPAAPQNRPTPPPGLPPVAPPTTGFVVQLFLVPALIVAFLVVFAMLLTYFTSRFFGPPSAEEVLKKLDDPNAEVRWRTAADLAQVLQRDDRLASDPDFALKLADRLEKAHARNQDAEKTLAERLGTLSEDDAARERKKLEGERTFIQYLSASLGTFLIPVGAPVLQKLAMQDGGMEPNALALQRRQAVFALAVLGERSQRFDKLPAVEQANIIAQLDTAIDRREHVEWAEATRDYLKARQAGQRTTMGVDITMEKCADAQEPFTRELAAFALNFWSGTDPENERIEATLKRLLQDDGHGEDVKAGEDPNGTTPVTNPPGRKINYDAAIALARRGKASEQVIGFLLEMLDEQRLREVLRLRKDNVQEEPDESLIEITELNALKAVAELKRRNPEAITEKVREAVNGFTSHKNQALANEAKQTQLVLK